MMRKLIMLVTGLALHQLSYGQCCSPGSPVAGSANVGIVNPGTLRVNSFYRHSLSEQYYEKSSKSDYQLVKEAGFDYVGLVTGYGIAKRITIELETGYFINKYQVYNLSNEYEIAGNGFSNGVLSSKVNLMKTPGSEWELTAGAGLKFPFNEKMKEVDHVVLPQELQPSTGAYGLVTQLFVRKGYSCHNL